MVPENVALFYSFPLISYNWLRHCNWENAAKVRRGMHVLMSHTGQPPQCVFNAISAFADG